MALVRSRNTKPELALRRALFRLGHRFRIHHSGIVGRPDIVFVRARVCVFVDGEFWHGYRWAHSREQIKVRRGYWIPKLEANMERDRRTNRVLRRQGWKVMRLWSRAVRREPERCAARIDKIVRSRAKSQS